MLIIYVERFCGKWEAFWYSKDEGRTFHFSAYDRQKAISKAVEASGYSLKDVKIVDC